MVSKSSIKDIGELQDDCSIEFNHHRSSLQDLFKMLHTNEEGLTEVEAQKRLETFGKNVTEDSKTVSVLRDTTIKAIDAQFLVPGDIVHLSKGDHISADMRIVSAENFMVNISALTGEGSPQPRSTKNTSDNPLETENLLFFPSIVAQGNAQAVVIFTGKKRIMDSVVKLATKL